MIYKWEEVKKTMLDWHIWAAGTYPYMRSHFICTDFCEVPAHHAIIQAIKQEQEAKVHGHLRFDEEEDIEPEQREHDDEVAHDASGVADFVNEEEPLVH